MSKRISVVIFTILMIPIFSSPVVGEWKEDVWLNSVIGPERLNLGDEFGCQGYENLNIEENLWTISSCRDYLVSLTNASRWGVNPISFGVSGSYISENVSEEIINSGFTIIGDQLISNPEGLIVMDRNGGSLEKNIANINILNSSEKDELISIHWIARVHDLQVREDKDVISWLTQQDIWFTTWGEWYYHRESGKNIQIHSEGTNNISISLDRTDGWNVPGSVKISHDSQIISILNQNNEMYPKYLENTSHLQIGWRQLEDGILVTLNPGDEIKISLNDSNTTFSYQPLTTFNQLHHSVTVVGHHTTNLFKWSKDFQNDEFSNLRFTWLIERPAAITKNWILPVLAVGIIIAVPIAIRVKINEDKDFQNEESE